MYHIQARQLPNDGIHITYVPGNSEKGILCTGELSLWINTLHIDVNGALNLRT